MKQLTDEVFAQVRDALKHGITRMNILGEARPCMPLHEAIAALDTAQPAKELAAAATQRYIDAQKQPVLEVNAMLVEALKDTAQTLAWMQHGKCRGFSDGLLTTQEALDKARAALTAAQQAQPERAPLWQPMQTAPRDGTRVLLRGYGTTQVAGYAGVAGCDFDSWVIANDVHIEDRFAEAWMPVPASHDIKQGGQHD